MRDLDGRVAIVTGAGRGLGRAHARALADYGARVVVNDLGSSVDGGSGGDGDHAQDVVDEIAAAGGQAIASHHDVSSWTAASDLVDLAIAEFGHVDVLVNNAGILRDRTIANMTESEWDDVIRVHLKGHASTTRAAMRYWRSESKSGRTLAPSVVNTTSVSGLCGNVGQANYAAAKLGIVALSYTASLEGRRYGVRANCVSPSARTRITAATLGDSTSSVAAGECDPFDPANVSPLVVWLARRGCPANEQVFHIAGSRVAVLKLPEIAFEATTVGRWSLEGLDRVLSPRLVERITGERLLRDN